MKVWRHYLITKKFILMTDHISLAIYFKQPTLNAQKENWATLFIEFDLAIKHLKGIEKKVVDAISRKLILFMKSIEQT